MIARIPPTPLMYVFGLGGSHETEREEEASALEDCRTKRG